MSRLMNAFKAAGPRVCISFMLFSLLLFIYPIKGTIALRNLLILTIFVCSWVGTRAYFLPRLKWVGVLILMLLIWLLGQAWLISPYPEIAVTNLSGDLLRGILAALLACQLYSQLSLALGNSRRASKWLLTACVVVLSCHSFRVFFEQFIHLIRQGSFNYSFPSRDVWSDVNNAALALLLADWVCRYLKKDSFFVWPSQFSLVLLLICLLDLFMLRTTIGTVTALAIITISGFLLVGHMQHRGNLVLIFTMLIAIVAINSDPRSHRFVDTLTLAWNIDQYEVGWLHGDRALWPHTESGEIVEESTFLRASWAHFALREVIAKPLGYGYSHRAFGYVVNKRLGSNRDISSSHNGWLDFALAGGIPALLLLVISEVWLMLYGLRCFNSGSGFWGIALLLVVADYTVRCSIDGHLSGARMEWFFLLTGLLAVMTARAEQEKVEVHHSNRSIDSQHTQKMH